MFFLLDTFGRFLYGADYDKANKRPRRKNSLNQTRRRTRRRR